MIIPAPGNLVTPVMMRIVTPLHNNSSLKVTFREWSVRDPAIVIAVSDDKPDITILTLMIVRTKRIWTLEIGQTLSALGGVKVFNAVRRHVP